MRDMYLRFKDADEMLQALITAGFTEDDDGGWLSQSGVCLDIVGTIYTTDNPEAEEPVYKAEPGWHVNLRVVNDDLDMTALDEFIVSPENPARVWA